jgi:hypothetical protein
LRLLQYIYLTPNPWWAWVKVGHSHALIIVGVRLQWRNEVYCHRDHKTEYQRETKNSAIDISPRASSGPSNEAPPTATHSNTPLMDGSFHIDGRNSKNAYRVPPKSKTNSKVTTPKGGYVMNVESPTTQSANLTSK